ncbi:DUF6185 family protein [Streptomyces sp. NPDC051104]|uniref:DUF6185 family protein n=1 Tax=Streptomyces sp. NPDC051104 TaxID=3155044 RepID=UPI003416296C
MTEIRWWRLLSLVVVAVVWGSSPAEARQVTGDVCRADQLDSTVVDAEIRFDQHRKNYVKVSSRMTVKVPNKWRHARHLTFDRQSSEYRVAMRCLLRGGGNAGRVDEWRPNEPRVTAQEHWVTVRYDAFKWIQNYKPFRVGPWELSTAGRKKWEVHLRPLTLQKVSWKHVRAKVDDLNFSDRSELASAANKKGLAWSDQMPEHIWFEVDLPWQRDLYLHLDQSFWKYAGIALWWVCCSYVIALAALRARYPSPALSGGKQEAQGSSARADRPAQSVLQWALLSGAVALMLLLLNPQRQPVVLRWRSLICITAGWALILVARPWCRGMLPAAPNAGNGKSDSAERRQARAVITTASVVAALGLVVVLAPELFGLPADLVSKTAPAAFGDAGLVLMGLATLWLWLAAMAAWAWRFAREGGLAPASWTAKWDGAPVRWLAAVGTLLGAVAVALLACTWWANDHQWKRLAWLTDHTDDPGGILANFSFADLTWMFAYSWTVAGLALIALLHFRVQAQRARGGSKEELFALGPDKPEVLMTVVLFAFFVGLRAVTFLGFKGQYGVWLFLSICSLYGVLAVGRRRSVLAQMGERFCMQRLGARRRRKELMTKAHQYRNLNRQLHLVDQGHAGGVTSEQLESQLHELHQWLVAGCGRKNPVEHISVLDVALAWGPAAHWWSNALVAARTAFCFGVPASGVLLFLDLRDSRNWLEIFYTPTGIPQVVVEFVLFQAAWAVAGFVLGALWRLLPGRSSPARAWSLSVAYAIPISLAALLVRLTDADYGYVFLYVVLMLTILTLTSIWMDTVTFREERQFWPSRFALLLSIYQLRGVSGQIAWLLAQVVAAVGIWHQLARR